MLKLYHGSNVIINEIDLCLSRKGKDFGCGFYLNPNESQAMEMAIRTTQRQKEGKPIVNTFIFDETVLTDESSPLSVKVFVDYSKEWAEFILMNRKNLTSTPAHTYDIVIGPIANDDVRTQFVKHMLGEITEIELMENLKWKRCTYQYCFISDEAISSLKIIGKL